MYCSFSETNLKPMSTRRKDLPVYDFSCSHMESFLAHFCGLSQKYEFEFDILRFQTLLNQRVVEDIRLYVQEELAGSLKFKMDKADDEFCPTVRVYVTRSNQIHRVNRLVKLSQMDKNNVLLLVVENDCDADDVLNVPNGILFARTLTAKLEDNLNNLLQRWVCRISYLMVEKIQHFQTKLCTGTAGTSTCDTGIYYNHFILKTRV